MDLGIASRLRLNDGNEIPYLGLGVWQTRSGKTCEAAVLAALELGYRHIDTAAVYDNEESVGIALRKSGLPREQVFITTKLWNQHHDNPAAALDQSLRRLGLDYVDLYLIHFPVPERNRSWEVLEKLTQSGKARSIGVSNFTIRHLQQLLDYTSVVPAVNQVELHPFLYQRELIEFCSERGIVIAAYSPLTHARRLDDPRLLAIAAKYPLVTATSSPWAKIPFIGDLARRPTTRTPAQVLIRWVLQHGWIVLPKSARKARIEENAAVYDFELTDEDMRALDGMNENLRTCWDPSDAP